MLEHASKLPRALAAIVKIVDEIRDQNGADDETTKSLVKHLKDIKSGALAFSESVRYLDAWKKAHHYSQTLVHATFHNVFRIMHDRADAGSDEKLVKDNRGYIESDFNAAKLGLLNELQSIPAGQYILPDLDRSKLLFSADNWHGDLANQALDAHDLYRANKPGEFMDAIEHLYEDYIALNGQADNRIKNWIEEFAKKTHEFGALVEGVDV